MSEKNIPKEDVQELAREIAAKALKEVMRATGGGGGSSGLGYECNQSKFECSTRYDCVAPDSCTYEVSCPKKHNPPV